MDDYKVWGNWDSNDVKIPMYKRIDVDNINELEPSEIFMVKMNPPYPKVCSEDGLMFFHLSDLSRDDEALVRVVEELDEEANGESAELEVVELPSEVDWYIDEFDGSEIIREKHRTW